LSFTISRDVLKSASFDYESESGAAEFIFRFEGLAPGDDLFKRPEVPPRNHAYRFNDLVTMYATRFGVEWDYDAPTSAGRLIVSYTASPASTGGGSDYIVWEKGYKKESMKIPAYVLASEWYIPAGQQTEVQRWKWVDADYSIPLELSVLTVTVNRSSSTLDTRSQILADMAVAESQHDHLHIFPQFPGRKWIMQPHNARQASVSRVQLTYSWISDPGNGSPGLPLDKEVADSYLLPAIERPPLHYYAVRPQQGLISSVASAKNPTLAPKFSVMPLYPEKLQNGNDNPRYTPDGWRTLAGKPMG